MRSPRNRGWVITLSGRVSGGDNRISLSVFQRSFTQQWLLGSAMVTLKTFSACCSCLRSVWYLSRRWVLFSGVGAGVWSYNQSARSMMLFSQSQNMFVSVLLGSVSGSRAAR